MFIYTYTYTHYCSVINKNLIDIIQDSCGIYEMANVVERKVAIQAIVGVNCHVRMHTAL